MVTREAVCLRHCPKLAFEVFGEGLAFRPVA
jgi:hypothetical protein